MAAYHLLIRGKVQGVFYRASASRKAKMLQLTGWVKNTPDGEVEIVVQGQDTQVGHFIAWCKKGPRDASVIEVIVTAINDGNFDMFNIIKG